MLRAFLSNPVGFSSLSPTRHPQKSPLVAGFLVNGALGRIRTPDPLVRSQVLYPTELPALSEGEILRILRWIANIFYGEPRDAVGVGKMV